MIYRNALFINLDRFGDTKGHQGALLTFCLHFAFVVLLIFCTLVVKEFIVQKIISYIGRYITSYLFVILSISLQIKGEATLFCIFHLLCFGFVAL